MPSYTALQPWIAPALFLAGGLLLGLLGEKLALPLIHRSTKKAQLESITLIAQSIRGMVLLWGVLTGLTGALTTIPIKPESARFLGKVPIVLFLFSLTIVLARISVGFFDLKARKKTGDTPTISLFTLIIKLIVYSIGIMVILQSLGISIAPALTALGVGGLAVALALQETLSNLFAGMQILASTILTNYHQPRRHMLVYVPVGVHYDSDLEYVEQVTLEVAEEVQSTVEGASKDFSPRIRYNELGCSSINWSRRWPKKWVEKWPQQIST